ncbi:predicted protein [Naegleria gruberi]|uniref:Predicted protein n=1 Tax=Naegleria gruberi TaxID=5762 RepID=D2VGR7_NAEGR|nr:uncharacterized protein NAEGRDRAFT_68072 [Naegleria gruberi]EFC44015.1 predicted protein [Naegleria gruberi]|eukprot:XP_002676759.1 predicted protein [Naegleria gruberi strain NEG-M]
MELSAASKNECPDLYCLSDNKFEHIGMIKHRANLNLDMMKGRAPNPPTLTKSGSKQFGSKGSNLNIRTDRKKISASSANPDSIAAKFRRDVDSPVVMRKTVSQASTSSNNEQQSSKQTEKVSNSQSSSQASNVMPESPRSDMDSSPIRGDDFGNDSMPVSPSNEEEVESKNEFDRTSYPHKPPVKARPTSSTYTVKVGTKQLQAFSLLTVAIGSGITIGDTTVKRPNISKIETFEQYNQYKKEFNENYKKYKELDKILNDNVEYFKGLASEWKTLPNDEKTESNNEIQKLFNRRKTDVQTLTKKFNAMHEELDCIKKLLLEYATRNASNGKSNDI